MTDTATAATVDVVFLELEWWDGRTGNELVLQAARAIDCMIVGETVHVYNPDCLTSRADQWGEMSVFVSVTVAPGQQPFIVDEIRATGIRVKTAGTIPDRYARAELDDVFAYWDSLLPDD